METVQQIEQITHRIAFDQEIWEIKCPHMKQKAEYPQIKFQEGDLVTVYSGGFIRQANSASAKSVDANVQRNNLDYSHHGLIYIPTVTNGFVRLSEVIGKPQRISAKIEEEESKFLSLALDNKESESVQGEGDGNAWVKIVIEQSAGACNYPQYNNAWGEY